MTHLLQPVPLVARWPFHGDLHIVVDGAYVYLRADDVERLAGIPAWGEGETVIGDEWPDELDGTPFYRLEQAIAKVRRHADSDTAAEFVAWLDESLPDLLDPRTVAAARPPESFTRGITVRHAAQRLTAEGLRVGRTGLFAHMQRLGWAERAGDQWSLTGLARDRGWATVRRIRHPAPGKGRHGAYDQIYILPAGLEQLRADLTPADPPVPADTRVPLFD
ncbi:hypothetical protein [Microbacterium karelineae]|uniref:hypothetical protein n=1 Tax=Microbacterium karelineae TaxID=2654283 RepID=UPI0012EA5BFB|nr:hypothetical protein [Microbacterium karelineae]